MRSTSEKVIWAITFIVILMLLTAIAVPSFIKARNTSCGAHACMNNLRLIDAGKEQAALAEKWGDLADCDNPSNKAVINMYIKGNTTPLCPDAGTYSYNLLSRDPTCSKYNKDDASTRSHHLPLSQ